jgi:hypothetical protein
MVVAAEGIHLGLAILAELWRRLACRAEWMCGGNQVVGRSYQVDLEDQSLTVGVDWLPLLGLNRVCSAVVW